MRVDLYCIVLTTFQGQELPRKRRIDVDVDPDLSNLEQESEAFSRRRGRSRHLAGKRPRANNLTTRMHLSSEMLETSFAAMAGSSNRISGVSSGPDIQRRRAQLAFSV